MEITVLLQIEVEEKPDSGPWQLNSVDEGKVSFDAPCVPPVGTILCLGTTRVVDALVKIRFKEGHAHKIAEHYCNWKVIEHGDWVVDPQGKLSVHVVCLGQNPRNPEELLKFDDLINPNLG